MSAVMQQQKNEVAPLSPQQAVKAAVQMVRSEIAAALPKHVSADRFVKTVLLAASQNPALARCNRQSFLLAVMKAAELGLTPNSALGECYLIPFKDQVQMIPGYRGLISLARRSDEILSIEAHVVYVGEVFEYELGMAPKFRHVPEVAATPGDKVCCYAIARLRGGGVQCEVVPAWRVLKIKADSLAKTRPERRAEAPWTKHEDEMWRKTAVRALFKYLPVSTESVRMSLERAMEIDDEAARDRGEIDAFAELGAPEEPPQIEAPAPEIKSALKAKAAARKAEAKPAPISNLGAKLADLAQAYAADEPRIAEAAKRAKVDLAALTEAGLGEIENALTAMDAADADAEQDART